MYWTVLDILRFREENCDNYRMRPMSEVALIIYLTLYVFQIATVYRNRKFLWYVHMNKRKSGVFIYCTLYQTLKKQIIFYLYLRLHIENSKWIIQSSQVQYVKHVVVICSVCITAKMKLSEQKDLSTFLTKWI